MQKLPARYKYIVEGYGRVDVFAMSPAEAHEKVEGIVGFNIYGKAILESELRDNEEHILNWRI